MAAGKKVTILPTDTLAPRKRPGKPEEIAEGSRPAFCREPQTGVPQPQGSAVVGLRSVGVNQAVVRVRFLTGMNRMESLRLMPPVPMTFRMAAKTDYIDGVLIPKGTLFYIPVRRRVCRGGLLILMSSVDTGGEYVEGDLGRGC